MATLKVVRYAKRTDGRYWRVWEVCLETKDGGTREVWGKCISEQLGTKAANDRIAQLNYELSYGQPTAQ